RPWSKGLLRGDGSAAGPSAIGAPATEQVIEIEAAPATGTVRRGVVPGTPTGIASFTARLIAALRELRTFASPAALLTVLWRALLWRAAFLTSVSVSAPLA